MANRAFALLFMCPSPGNLERGFRDLLASCCPRPATLALVRRTLPISGEGPSLAPGSSAARLLNGDLPSETAPGALSQRSDPALQRGRQIAHVLPYDRRALAKARSLSADPLFVTRRLDRREGRPVTRACSLCWQELAAQH